MIIGVTGLIGAGKTHVSMKLQDYIKDRVNGIFGFDSDKVVYVSLDSIAKDIQSMDFYIKKLKKVFPEVFIGDKLDKEKVKDIIISEKSKDFNNIIIDPIKTYVKDMCTRNKNLIVILEYSLVDGLSFDGLLDINVIVSRDEDERIQSVLTRNKDYTLEYVKRLSFKQNDVLVGLSRDFGISVDNGKDISGFNLLDSKILGSDTVIDGLIEKVLSQYTNMTLEFAKDCYKNRYYHDWEHVRSIVRSGMYSNMLESVVLFAVFHDIVYDPKKDDNEIPSRNMLSSCTVRVDKGVNECVQEAILNTGKDLEYLSGNMGVDYLRSLDLDILNKSIVDLIKWENGIFKEYQFSNIKDYISKRVDFLMKAYSYTGNNHIVDLVKYIKSKRYKIGLYVGSFNPMHVGHMDILEQAENVFDKVIICYGQNADKVNNPIRLPKTFDNREIVVYSNLITDFIKGMQFEYPNVDFSVVWGIRNSQDLEKAKGYKDFIEERVDNVGFSTFICAKEFEFVSSTMVRELESISYSDEANRYIV